jgi:hypothetical protein
LAFHSGREADRSPPSSAEIKEWVELYLHSPNTPLWRGAELGGAQGQPSFNVSVSKKKKQLGPFLGYSKLGRMPQIPQFGVTVV